MTQLGPQSPGSAVSPGKYRLLGFILLLGVALDQLSKWWVAQTLAPQAVVPIIPGFFNLVHVYNKGAAFGLLATWPSAGVRFFFVGVNLLILAVLGYLYQRTPREYPLFLWGYSLVLSGAVGNLVDRLRWGEVLDFLDFYLGRHHWPAFNVADSLICVGAGLLVLAMWRTEEERDVSRSA